MDKPSTIENRVYLLAFALILLISLCMCSYYDGRTDEDLRESQEHDQTIASALQAMDYWKQKYEALTHEADAVTVLAAVARFEQGEAQ